MGFEHKNNTGSLFANDKRDPEKNHPTHTGQGKIDGVDYWINAWVKEANGKRFFSISFKPKEERRQEAPPPPDQQDIDDDVPF